MIPESQDAIAQSLELAAATLVVRRALVLRAVGLDHELVLEAHEIEKRACDGMLPAELSPADLTPFQGMPEPQLGVGRIFLSALANASESSPERQRPSRFLMSRE